MKPRLLDLFCGAGGCTRGYQRAGFHVVGVDLKRQPRYCGDEFWQADAMTFPLDGFDAIHASPPCQGYSRLLHLPWFKDRTYPLLIAPLRERFVQAGIPWVIENVADAPLDAITLCGLHFGLCVYRHRKFESNLLLLAPGGHPRHPEVIFPGPQSRPGVLRPKAGLNFRAGCGILSIGGHTSGNTRAKMSVAMGIDWMTRDELTQAIPPAYTQFVGRQLMRALVRTPR